MFARKSEANELKVKLNALKERIFSFESTISSDLRLFWGNKLKYVVFLSVSDGESRAFVCKGIGNSIDTCWKSAVDLLLSHINKSNMNPLWLKADLVKDVKEYDYESFMSHVDAIKTNYFREGISFDSMFNTAFLEQEVNANVFFNRDDKTKPLQFSWGNIETYLRRTMGINYRSIKDKTISKVYTFTTIAAFHDEQSCMDLLGEDLNNGRRHIDQIDKSFLYSLLTNTTKFLTEQVDEGGKFRYGYFACYDKVVPGYNILRHASTTYSMIEAYEITKNPSLADAIRRCLNYLISEGIQTIEDGGIKRAYVIEGSRDNEIKLGANAAAIFSLAKYTKVFNDQQYQALMASLAHGIESFQNSEIGSYVHVLNFPDLSIKDEYRTIYYDGEATFALMRLYDIDRNQRWIDMAKKAFAYFIDEKYWRTGDHWLSYCSNELIKHSPDRKYIAFNLNNASGKLDFCLTRETTYPTLLELLLATNNTIQRMKQERLHLDLLDEFDEVKFEKAIAHRVSYQLNGLFFPEFAMYFKAPSKILWAFYIRHHSFRSRIDDNEHYISGYSNYYHALEAGQQFNPE